MTRFEEGTKRAHGGFALMDKIRHLQIARRGGIAAHEKGTAHEFTSDEARAAGRKGAAALLKKRGPSHMSEIGKLGGRASRKKKGIPFEDLAPEVQKILEDGTEVGDGDVGP